MFSLIVTIVAIALVAALALAVIYYGGDALNIGASRTASAKSLQEGNQIAGALELYRADHGDFPSGTSDEIKQTLLTANYLKAIPTGSWSFRNDFAVQTDLDERTCLALNQKLGITGTTVPACNDSTISGKSVCCEVTP